MHRDGPLTRRMPSFEFRVFRGSDQGPLLLLDLASPDQVRGKALQLVRILLSEARHRGRNLDRAILRVADASGHVILAVPIGEPSRGPD